jgi:hypothetical protein
MHSKPEENDQIEIRCPVCKERVQLDAREAERAMSVRCPRGHEIPLLKAL